LNEALHENGRLISQTLEQVNINLIEHRSVINQTEYPVMCDSEV